MLLPELKEIPPGNRRPDLGGPGLTACALERFRLVHGSFPESLAALVPSVVAALPTDPITGELYRYRRFAGGYQLYPVGWNERDDRGVPAPPRSIGKRETGSGVRPVA